MPPPAGRHADPFSMVGKPLPTSLAAGHDMKVVQETLGLSSITIAADTYTSVLPQLARRSAEDVAALIRPAAQVPPPPRRPRQAAGPARRPAGTPPRPPVLLGSERDDQQQPGPSPCQVPEQTTASCRTAATAPGSTATPDAGSSGYSANAARKAGPAGGRARGWARAGNRRSPRAVFVRAGGTGLARPDRRLAGPH
jgi:hypothetical protein